MKNKNDLEDKWTRKEMALFALAFVLLMSLVLFKKYLEIKEINAFSMAKITHLYETPRKFNCNYVFSTVNGKEFSGFVGLWKAPKNYAGEKMNYLVGYSTLNPKVAHIFLNYPVKEDFNIDSLNQCCKPHDIITIRDYFR